MTQLKLFRNRWYQRFVDRIIGRLLWAANSNPPDDGNCLRSAFYRMKDDLLRSFGTIVGEDVQHIELKCNRCHGSGEVGPYWDRDVCWKCDGTGTYRDDYHTLSRWDLGGYQFHRPESVTHEEPAGGATIEGKVRHKAHPRAFDAAATLALLFDWRLLRWMLWSSPYYWGAPGWTPFGIVRRALQAVRYVTDRIKPDHCCECGKRFWSVRVEYYCPSCRQIVTDPGAPF